MKTFNLDSQSVPIIDVSAYNEIKYPKNNSLRYSTLHGADMKLIEAVKNNNDLYKQIFVQLSSMLETAICDDENMIQ